ncbi:four helix bundle protein [Oscillatoria amoena NRMC-F 0135]|nr:four helix bundle protein [Oscillatoria amoena NRMC-F 0135]
MSAIKKFEDLNSWKKARELTRSVYCAMKNCKDYSFKDQIQRASVSVMSNIAEGFERSGSAERIHLFNIARASAGEVRSLSYVGEDSGYLSSVQAEAMRNLTLECSQLIGGMMRYLRQKTKPST